MLKSIEAIIEKDGAAHLKGPVHLVSSYQAIVAVIDESSVPETALLSEEAFAENWNRPEEDKAWSHLQQAQ